jgi:hypothetical protein
MLTKMNSDNWDELISLKDAITFNPATVHPDEMEKFTELFVQTLLGKSEYGSYEDPSNY